METKSPSPKEVKRIVILLTAFFFAGGIVEHWAWVAAAVCALIAIGLSGPSPEGLRPDGKPRTGGFLGALWDKWELALVIRDCPFCKAKIMKDARECPHCGQLVENSK